MSGHSKWHKIRHKKGAADKKRGALFSKLSKAISVAARDGADPDMNFTLRLAIEKAKAANMPKDNIERAVARGSGADGAQLTSAVYEAMGPGGVSLLITSVTDNTNRALTNIKTIVTKRGGNFDAKVLWQFDHKGVIRATGSLEDKDSFELSVIDAGADDIQWGDEDDVAVIGPIAQLQDLEKVVRGVGLTIESAELEYVPNQTMELDDAGMEKLGDFVDAIEEDDDVSSVFTNVA